MSMIYWSILNYSIWKRIHIDNEPLETLKDELTNSIAEQKYLELSKLRGAIKF